MNSDEANQIDARDLVILKLRDHMVLLLNANMRLVDLIERPLWKIIWCRLWGGI